MKDGSIKGVWEDYEHIRDYWMIERGRNMDYIGVIAKSDLEAKPSGGGFG